MAMLVHDCPRCPANQITFDVYRTIEISIQYGWQRWYEAFSVCRNCHRSTVFVISQKNIEDRDFLTKSPPTDFDESLNPHFDIDSYICIRDMGAEPIPDHVPAPIASAFREAAICVVTGCWNAAGAMFRLAIDQTTIPMLPEEDIPGLNKNTRRNLGLRLPWLFANKLLPIEIESLSTCIREDGNDGAHAGTLAKEDARDLQDFTVALLERIYTTPARIQHAEKRRDKRREPRK